MKDQTIAIREQYNRTENSEHSVPLYLTSSYLFSDAEDMRSQFAEEKDGLIYSRYANPNVEELIRKLCLLERAESGWATATGMSAIFTLFGSLLESGDHVVCSNSVFGSTYKVLTELLPKWRIETSWVDYSDYEAYELVIKDSTKLVFIETPSNPSLSVIDIEKIASICREKGVLLVVDNCFATPLLQKPIVLGADVVVHSATKYLDGQGRVLGGLILSSAEIIEKVKSFARHSGPSMSPFNAWVLSKSIETLDVRMERHCKNSLEIAQRLESHTAISKVNYPFLPSHNEYDIAVRQMRAGGGLIAFELKDGLTAGVEFLDRLKLFSLTANLGDVRSIATHPASTTHSKVPQEQRMNVGITDGLVRLSIGLEDLNDIWYDIEQALN